MPSREALLKLADEYKADAETFDEKARQFAALAAKARQNERELREAAASTKQVLHTGHVLSRVDNTSMDNSHRINISRSRSRGRPNDPFSTACRRAKLTQGGLAQALGIDPALLSRYRKGTRPIHQERADRVKALTGWPADKAHWPGGIVPLD